MELGEMLRQARLEAGLSQRELCADVITRNMLSQIEHGAAKPSMSTLQYLAGRLGHTVGYFLGEAGAASVNTECVDAAWKLFEAGQFRAALAELDHYQEPDPILERSFGLLSHLVLLEYAQECISSGKPVFGRQLLEKAEQWEEKHTWLPELKDRRMRLQCRMEPGTPEALLPSLDGDLFLHARAALYASDAGRAALLLDAASDHSSAQWNLLRGRAALLLKDHHGAIQYLLNAGETFSRETAPLLEAAYREIGDYRMAYEYACRCRDYQTTGSQPQERIF